MTSIHESNLIHPTANIGNNVQIGKGNRIGAYTIINDGVIIGDNNFIGSHCCIGNTPQAKACTGYLTIGSANQINHYVCIDKGTHSNHTFISNQCTIFNYSYIAHDCKLKEQVHLGNTVHLAGNVTIQKNTEICSNTVINEHICIGKYCYIGASSSINKHIIPFMKVAGGYDARPIAYYKHPKILAYMYPYLRCIFQTVCKDNISEHDLPAVLRDKYVCSSMDNQWLLDAVINFLTQYKGIARYRNAKNYR